MPLSATRTHWSGTRSRSRKVCSKSVLNVRRSRLFTPISVAPASNTRCKIFGIVNLDEGRHAQADDFVVQLAQVAIVEAFGDQQHRIGAGGAGFVNLIRVENEILSQHRQPHGGANLLQIEQAALEERAVGQHAQATGAVPLVGVRRFATDRNRRESRRPTDWRA